MCMPSAKWAAADAKEIAQEMGTSFASGGAAGATAALLTSPLSRVLGGSVIAGSVIASGLASLTFVGISGLLHKDNAKETATENTAPTESAPKLLNRNSTTTSPDSLGNSGIAVNPAQVAGQAGCCPNCATRCFVPEPESKKTTKEQIPSTKQPNKVKAAPIRSCGDSSCKINHARGFQFIPKGFVPPPK